MKRRVKSRAHDGESARKVRVFEEINTNATYGRGEDDGRNGECARRNAGVEENCRPRQTAQLVRESGHRQSERAEVNTCAEGYT